VPHGAATADQPWDAALGGEAKAAAAVAGNALVLAQLVDELRTHAFAAAFLAPVPALLRSYHAVIASPRDLRTIATQLQRGTYGGTGKAELAAPRLIADLRLVFHNCRRFNAPQSTLARMAEVLHRLVETRLREAVALSPEAAAQLRSLRLSECPPLDSQ